MTTTATPQRPQRRSEILAIGLVLLSSLLYVLGYGLSKSLTGTYGLTALQVTFMRCALVLSACCASTLWPGSGITWRRIARPVRAWEQRAAAAAVVASIYFAVLAYGLMPVTEASALGFTAPLLLTALAGLVLGERVSVNRWLAAAAGFSGMLLIVRPGAAALSPGLAAALSSALAYALYQVLVRRLRDVATSLDSVIQVALVGVVVLAGAMAYAWRPVDWRIFGMVLAATAVQTAGLVCIASALRRGEASRLAPWQFSGLIWALLLDAVMFGSNPSLGALAGSVLILGGGVLAQTGSPLGSIKPKRAPLPASPAGRRKPS